MSDILVLQHVHCETLGTIAEALEASGLTARYVRPFAGQPVPRDMDEAAGLIVLGGPMGVHEQGRYPFLRDELRLIEAALRAEKAVLGVCLGSQLLAAALGAQVRRGKQKEIGWYPIRPAPAALADPLWTGLEPSLVAYHWHGDVFDLPAGATLLASSDRTAHQALRYGRAAYGLLCHLEVTHEIIAAMVATFADELREVGLEGEAVLQGAEVHLPRLREIGSVVFRRWASLAAEERR